MMAKTTSWEGFFSITNSLGKAPIETTANKSLLSIKVAREPWKKKIKKKLCDQL